MEKEPMPVPEPVDLEKSAHQTIEKLKEDRRELKNYMVPRYQLDEKRASRTPEQQKAWERAAKIFYRVGAKNSRPLQELYEEQLRMQEEITVEEPEKSH